MKHSGKCIALCMVAGPTCTIPLNELTKMLLEIKVLFDALIKELVEHQQSAGSYSLVPCTHFPDTSDSSKRVMKFGIPSSLHNTVHLKGLVLMFIHLFIHSFALCIGSNCAYFA